MLPRGFPRSGVHAPAPAASSDGDCSRSPTGRKAMLRGDISKRRCGTPIIASLMHPHFIAR